MLIDDDEDDNYFHEKEIIENNLAKTVIVKDSVRKALEYLKSKNDPSSDLIFLDINMPGMSGWDFLEEYNKLDKELQNKTIIIMLSTSSNPKDIQKAKALASVSDYINKPLKKEMVEAILKKHFKK